jgi:hypothetical protein
MTTDDELYDTTPDNADAVHTNEGHVIPEIPEDTGFPERWAEGDDDSAEAVEGFGGRWSGRPDDSAGKAEEFGDRWSGKPEDDSPERSEDFGATWSGENQPPQAV